MKLDDYILKIVLYIPFHVDTLSAYYEEKCSYYTYVVIHSFSSYALYCSVQSLYEVNNKVCIL